MRHLNPEDLLAIFLLLGMLWRIVGLVQRASVTLERLESRQEDQEARIRNLERWHHHDPSTGA